MKNQPLKPGWRRVKFGDVVQLSKMRSQDPLADGIERYVGLEHLEPGDLRIRSWGNVADGVTFTSVFKPGQVLFGKRRAYQRKVAVADFSGVCSGDIYVLETKDAQVLLPELLPFICQTDAFFEHAVGTSAGSLSPRTNWTSLADFEFVLPSIQEQARLVDLLSQFENALESYRALKESIVTKQAALLNEFFTPKIANGSSSSNPESLGALCEIKTGKLDSNAAKSDGEFPFFTCSPETLRIDRFSFDCDAVLLAGNNAQGNFSVKRYNGKFDAYQRTYVITPKKNAAVLTGYIELTLKRALMLLKNYSVGSTTKYLTIDVIKNINLPIVPLQEQSQVIYAAEKLAEALVAASARFDQLSTIKGHQLRSVSQSQQVFHIG